MKKYKKGFIIMLILLVIVIILAVFGIVFYMAKSSNSSIGNLPKVEENLPQENQIVNNTEKDCLPTTIPWIKVLSPNGGETYYKNSAIDLKWKSCNVPSTIHLNAQLIDVYNNSSDGLALLCEGGSSTWGPECLNDGEQVFGTIKWKAGIYKIKIASSEGVSVVGISDNSFTILGENSSNIQPHESGNDLNGQHLGYIKSVSLSQGNYSMKIDYIQWISPCPSDIECPNGYEIKNDSSLLRTFPVLNNITVTALTEPGVGLYNNRPQQISLNSFQALFKSNTIWTDSIPYWITLKNGVVIKIFEQYVP